jgi:hypothetical protein
MDRAVCEVEMVAMNQRDTTSRRIAYFLELWYRQGEPVTFVADAMELSRSHVAHSILKRALELVARRFLRSSWTRRGTRMSSGKMPPRQALQRCVEFSRISRDFLRFMLDIAAS